MPYGHVAGEVEDVVGDLKRGAKQKSEPVETIELPVVSISDKRTDPHRMNEAVPGGLLQHEPQIVFRLNREIIVPDPSQFDGLPLQTFDEHVIDFVEDAQRHRRAQNLHIPAEKTHGQGVHGVAGVDRNRHPGTAMHGGDTTSQFAAILDVVVHEKGVVQHFDAGRRQKRIVRTAAQRTRGGDAERRPQAFARSIEEILHQGVEMPLRLQRRHAGSERAVEHLSVPAQPFQKVGRPGETAGNSGRVAGKIALRSTGRARCAVETNGSPILWSKNRPARAWPRPD